MRLTLLRIELNRFQVAVLGVLGVVDLVMHEAEKAPEPGILRRELQSLLVGMDGFLVVVGEHRDFGEAYPVPEQISGWIRQHSEAWK